MRSPRTWPPLAAALAVLLAGVGALPGQESETPDPARRPHANAPEEPVPVRKSGPPHQRFFTERQACRGPRDGKARAGAVAWVGLLLPVGEMPDARRGAMIRRGVETALAEAAADPEAPRCELVVTEDAARLHLEFLRSGRSFPPVTLVPGATGPLAFDGSGNRVCRLGLARIRKGRAVPWILRAGEKESALPGVGSHEVRDR